MKHSIIFKLKVKNIQMVFQLGLHRILNCRISGRRISGHFFCRIPDIRLNSYHIICFSLNLYYQLNFLTFLIAISLLYSTKRLCLLFLIQNSFSGRISGKRNWISGRIPDTKKGQISGATLFLTLTMINGSQLKILPLK